MTEHLLKEFLNEHVYDIRVIRDGTWIDQKCAPDEVRFVAECILAYLDETKATTFCSPDIWHSEFAANAVQAYFGKPDPFSKEATDEYNKFFRQPMKMFAVAGVLKNEGRSGSGAIQFSVANRDVLSFVARNDWNAYLFLTHYVEKVLKDSGAWDPFATFLELQTADSINNLRDAFAKFLIDNTPKNTPREAMRILPKVLNALACRYRSKGIMRGQLSKFKITYSVLRYNQENWRDVGKPKDVTRQEYAGGKGKIVASEPYQVQKAKQEVRVYNDTYRNGESEVVGMHHAGKATHMHHMFMASQFPMLAAFPENIIALTPGQHLGLAHPDGNASVIDADYQYTCLLSKAHTIEMNVSGKCGQVGFYDFNKFAYVLNEGLSAPEFSDVPDNDFSELQKLIDAHCG